jgi:hypothetical protein
VSSGERWRNPIAAARSAAEHAARLARLELELRTVELKGKTVRAGVGAGLALLAVLLAPLLLVLLLAAAAAALATVVSVWLAILIVAGVLLILISALAGAAALLISAAVRGGAGATP